MRLTLCLTMYLFVLTTASAIDLSQPVVHELRLRCAETGVPEIIVHRLIWSESRNYPRAVNPRDPSRGLAQLLDSNLGLFSMLYNDGRPVDPYDPVVSVRVAVRYLADLHRQTGGDWYWSVVAYKAGLASVEHGHVWRSTAPEWCNRVSWWVAHGNTEVADEN